MALAERLLADCTDIELKVILGLVEGLKEQIRAVEEWRSQITAEYMPREAN